MPRSPWSHDSVNPAPIALPRRLLAEAIGTGLLATVVVGSGVAAQGLSAGGTGLQLLENSGKDVPAGPGQRKDQRDKTCGGDDLTDPVPGADPVCAGDLDQWEVEHGVGQQGHVDLSIRAHFKPVVTAARRRCPLRRCPDRRPRLVS